MSTGRPKTRKKEKALTSWDLKDRGPNTEALTEAQRHGDGLG